ncbi:hypothetical protein BSKO_06939 [Bryopsis sp. KO-2023]|nr:hypothetical protein BSKO_06939 [Bryopsis sp. KO-2023]
MDSVTQTPQKVDAVGITYITKKASKAKKFATKLRSSLSRKAGRDSIDSMEVGTPSPKESVKEKGRSLAKKSLEMRFSSSFKKLKKKLGREGKTAPSDDSVDMSGESGGSSSREVSVDEFVERARSNLAFQPVLQNTVVEVDSTPDAETLKQELQFDVQPDGKIVEDVPGKEDIIFHVVDGSESDSTSCPPTPDVADDNTKQVSPPSDLWVDDGGTEPLADFDPPVEENAEEGSETVETQEETLKVDSETVEAPEKAVEKASATVESVEGLLQTTSTCEQSTDSVETPKEPVEMIPEIVEIVDEVVEQTSEMPKETVETVETSKEIVEIVEMPQNVPENEELSGHAVDLDSSVEEGVDSGECDGEKSSNAVLADEGVAKGVTIQSRAIDLGDLGLVRGEDEDETASEDGEPPEKAKRGSRRARVFGAAGVAAGAVIFVAKLVAAR